MNLRLLMAAIVALLFAAPVSADLVTTKDGIEVHKSIAHSQDFFTVKTTDGTKDDYVFGFTYALNKGGRSDVQHGYLLNGVGAIDLKRIVDHEDGEMYNCDRQGPQVRLDYAKKLSRPMVVLSKEARELRELQFVLDHCSNGDGSGVWMDRYWQLRAASSSLVTAIVTVSVRFWQRKATESWKDVLALPPKGAEEVTTSLLSWKPSSLKFFQAKVGHLDRVRDVDRIYSELSISKVSDVEDHSEWRTASEAEGVKVEARKILTKQCKLQLDLRVTDTRKEGKRKSYTIYVSWRVLARDAAKNMDESIVVVVGAGKTKDAVGPVLESDGECVLSSLSIEMEESE